MTPQQADFLTVPLLDGSRGLTQVFEVEDRGIYLGLTDRRLTEGETPSPCPSSAFTTLTFTTAAGVTDGLWTVEGFDQLPALYHAKDYAADRALDFPEKPVREPAVVEAFLNAWHGLYDWQAFGDLFDRMLRPGVERP